MMEGKVIVFSAPSGSGKSTIVNYLLSKGLGLEFSISATSRPPRGKERNGVEYFFYSNEEFQSMVTRDEFLEWEEVYPGCCYGTLKREVQRIWSEGKTVIFDVDVKGGMNIKKIFGTKALSLFIQAPSIEELRRRLLKRGTDSLEKIKERVAKAEYETSFSSNFDITIVNDDLEEALDKSENAIRNFIKNK